MQNNYRAVCWRPENMWFHCDTTVSSTENPEQYFSNAMLLFYSRKEVPVRLVSQPTPSGNPTPAPAAPAPTHAITVTVRRCGKPRGGVEIDLPNSMEELLQVASRQLEIVGVAVMNPDKEVFIKDLKRIGQDAILWILTEEEKKTY